MKKYYHNKLVRDRIPEIIESRGGAYEAKIVTKAEAKKLLRRKLIEESKEILNSSKDRLLNELTDILQIIKSIAYAEGLEFREIETFRKNKEKKAGSYKKGVYLIWSDKPQGFGDKKNK